MKQSSIAPDRAALIGVQALSWIATDDDLLGLFMDQAGTDADDVRARATDPGFLGFVLDFILQDDARVIGFAGAQGMAPEDVAGVRRALPGGDVPEWT